MSQTAHTTLIRAWGAGFALRSVGSDRGFRSGGVLSPSASAASAAARSSIRFSVRRAITVGSREKAIRERFRALLRPAHFVTRYVPQDRPGPIDQLGANH